MPAPLPHVTATRFVLPLREGGSMPGLVEADDDGMYVVKFTGAGQGRKVLVAEVVVAGIGRRLGVRVPDLAVVDLPSAIAKYEADEEVQDLLDASPGRNLGVDFLPGAFGYDGSAPPPPDEAGAILWLDAFTANVDRTWANPNLLLWHGRTWAIDHGAALYMHHSWPSKGSRPEAFAGQRFDASTHVLAGVAGDMATEHERASALLTASDLADVVAQVPDEWLETASGLPTPDAVRAAYVENLAARLAAPAAWLPTREGGGASGGADPGPGTTGLRRGRPDWLDRR
ncbi:HipA family kinase [Agilicoccus flavus]|uniref:HipA family kinase n=1 Tax=Agilicoccus flavus TaxID=2775968 RepID=UPI0027DA8E34|nr:HipA family kinase [Agilicoccus flavus]